MSNYKGDDRKEQHYTESRLIEEMFLLQEKWYPNPKELLENSAGDGRIIDEYIKRYDNNYIAFDIDPKREDIKECNYLKEKIDYKEGRIAMINPPFQIGLKFLYKALEESDYVIAILSQNSLLNIDYNKVWCDEIHLWSNYQFETCKVSIIMIACRKKREGDKYEFE